MVRHVVCTGLFAISPEWLYSAPCGATRQWRATCTLSAMKHRAIGCLLAAFIIVAAAAARRAYKPGSVAHRATVPDLVVVSTPVIYISVHGEPVFRKIRGTKFSRLSDTERRIFRDDTSGWLYLELKQFWMSARSLSGPWSPEPNPPIAISEVDGRGDTDTVGEVDRELYDIQAMPAPHVVVSLRPSLLIEINGTPEFTSIRETGLQYVRNANGEVFKFAPTGAFYALAGRNWYYALSLWGPWRQIPAIDIPANFTHIPPGHPKAHVLACLPEAADRGSGRE
jgi:hypothetical protein